MTVFAIVLDCYASSHAKLKVSSIVISLYAQSHVLTALEIYKGIHISHKILCPSFLTRDNSNYSDSFVSLFDFYKMCLEAFRLKIIKEVILVAQAALSLQ